MKWIASIVLGALATLAASQATNTAPNAAAASRPSGRFAEVAMTAPILSKKGPVQLSVWYPGSFDKDTTRTYPLVVFLHGINEGAAAAIKRGVLGPITSAIESGALPEAVIVVPDLDGNYGIDGAEPNRQMGSHLADEFLGALPKELRATGPRVLVGVTTGAAAALRLALLRPESFPTVLAIAPAIFAEDPHNASHYCRRTLDFYAGELHTLFGTPVPAALWKASNAIAVAKTAPLSPAPRIRIIAAEKDLFGWSETVKSFHDALDARKVTHDFSLVKSEPGEDLFATRFAGQVDFVRGALERTATSRPSSRPAGGPK